ncbi:MAG: type II toxin-antitoxin system HicB family antitoxin [Deltaproteobacteria bacterium]|nr:type II toxin-antitoxin system HicB family antitoxin [Deltaproteobacteria bacterium]
MATERKAKILSYTVLFEPLPEGGYNVVVPAIPEICTFGRTFAEARRMGADALRCYVESVEKARLELPRDIRRSPRIERLEVKRRSA